MLKEEKENERLNKWKWELKGQDQEKGKIIFND